MLRKRIVSLPVLTVLATISLLLFTQCAAPAASSPRIPNEAMEEPTISLSGQGTAEARPDAAVVRLGVQTEAELADAALAQNNQQVQALMQALKDAGVAEEDIQTQALRLHPRYQEPAEERERELVGYVATNMVQVRTQDLENLGALLDTAVQAGGNRIEGIRFEVSDPAAYLDEAREAAWQDAQHQAKQLAALANRQLGPVLSIQTSGRAPRPVLYETAEAGARGGGVPIEAGTQSLEVTVQVTWRLQ
jgi:hypothetical protein